EPDEDELDDEAELPDDEAGLPDDEDGLPDDEDGLPDDEDGLPDDEDGLEVPLVAVEASEKAAAGTDDDLDEVDVLVRVVSDDDEDPGDDIDGLREGEFICRSCFLAKGPTQLADAKKMLCVDCV
ncbi:MAG: hypothetical protein ACRDUY_14345, partial [Nitriliruptorales bacterium]